MIKPIAIYLPQFHPFPENDEWWGKGFTEWTNVTKSTPKFEGHYQPHLPRDLGFYDLRLEDTLIAQSELAKKYGIFGFCYYHYWFNGKLLMEKPLENMLSSKKVDMPFCLCWANENWTRRWDGHDELVLIKQTYNLEDDLNHIQYLIKFFKDPRYIKIENRPVLLIYRTELHPNIEEATEIWRREVKKAGFPDLYLIRVENILRDVDPSIYGFDAAMDFAPDFNLHKKLLIKENFFSYKLKKFLHKSGIKKNNHFTNTITKYSDLVNRSIAKAKSNYKRFSCVTPSWDNSARREQNALVYHQSTPEKFGEWVKQTAQFTNENFKDDEKIFFINAWNEWAEGNHMEPDLKFGTAYLEAFKENFKSE
ncbi:glycoside hydrolase family 99-like domain-containing protein [Sphingobacterium sp.]|uniref:glycosyltransferase WbsX family protein n=1 Tax=Sphingobacterium sp. TaxID=341027 RepID=UPI0028AC397B|nr:glycoside hydrolase family 99-like domain-containing protein [Sphingobacterium sp.]